MLTNNSICVDYGGDYCPCILGETGNCNVCNQLNGGDFCDCKAGGAFCVKQELIRNNMKARKGREALVCSIIRKGVVDIPLLIIMDSLIPLYGCMMVQPIVDFSSMIVAFILMIRHVRMAGDL
ncbi:MAG: hypothetical protein K6G42_09920 [Lachnospiraceae bacterium]|nr:hypothetical protein [Lachnospiraceae bacterium]